MDHALHMIKQMSPVVIQKCLFTYKLGASTIQGKYVYIYIYINNINSYACVYACELCIAEFH